MTCLVKQPMKKSFPVTPFPLLGEIVYECAMRSGLVSSNADEDSKLYADLKALKDDRKRPALRPASLPLEILVELESRLAKYIRDEMHACLTFVQIRRVLEFYAFAVGNADVTLLTREETVEQILWPTLFSAAAAACLEPTNILFHVADLKSLLDDKAPFARFLRSLCTRGIEDYRLIWMYRTKRYNIDPENCEQTFRDWLSGSTIPTLNSCSDILEALGMSHDAGTRQWVLIARLLAKTSHTNRLHILKRIGHDPELPVYEEFHQLRKAVGWRAGKRLRIGPDRPFSKIKNALYTKDTSRDPLTIQQMLERQRVAWEPIAANTTHILEWLWGRHLVLNARYAEAFDRYLCAYEWGFGRDGDILKFVVNEIIALAGKLGKWRAAEKYFDIASLYGEPTWDGSRASIEEYFNTQFPPELFFFQGPPAFKS